MSLSTARMRSSTDPVNSVAVVSPRVAERMLDGWSVRVTLSFRLMFVFQRKPVQRHHRKQNDQTYQTDSDPNSQGCWRKAEDDFMLAWR